jgi:hypothetical protein
MALLKGISPLSQNDRIAISLNFDMANMPLLGRLPWHKPLLKWTRRDARFLLVKSGLSRHVVRFVTVKGENYAVKETNAEIAEREFRSYQRLHTVGIPTLLPVGTVIRNEGKVAVETHSGTQFESHATGYLVTSLLEYSLPNYHLFKRAFRRENRRHIWDAIVRLFVQLHLQCVYWGDASLSNMMIVFVKQHFPEIGVRTILKAVLADAETVEFPQSLSSQLRRADVDHFLESMLWTEADMTASGLIREPLMTAEDQEYILQRYLDLYEIEREEQNFEIITKIDVDALLGPFERKGQSKALLKHIYEHKWYLSEREHREINVDEAAGDWYIKVFKPVLRLVNHFEILEEFPDRTASTFYLDIMLHKYYLSERIGRDVGLIAALEDYAKQFTQNAKAARKLSSLANSMRELFKNTII